MNKINIVLYDHLSKEKKTILDKSNVVKMYVCGPTVYNTPHIGNMRPILTYDVLNRLLLELKIDKKFVHNITDVDDKIINKAIEQNKSEKEISEKYFNEYMDILNKYNIIHPEIMPKVTEHIHPMNDFIKKLVDKKVAYSVDGNVFLEIKTVKNYGSLANIDMGDHSHESEEFSEIKKDPRDFVLWKNTKVGITWDSPWGKGRPGWHTECSYFVQNFFNNETINVHGGGIDLKFPHHVNEKAQFEVLLDKPMSETWTYVGHVSVNKEKMSKSIGNVISALEFLKDHSSNILRNIFYSVHYTKPIDFNQDTINTSINELEKWKNSLQSFYKDLIISKTEINQKVNAEVRNQLLNALADDLNTTLFKDIIHKLFGELHSKSLPQEKRIETFNTILFAFNLLGLKYNILKDKEIINKYLEAIENKDYSTSDLIREKLVTL